MKKAEKTLKDRVVELIAPETLLGSIEGKLGGVYVVVPGGDRKVVSMTLRDHGFNVDRSSDSKISKILHVFGNQALLFITETEGGE